MNKKLLFLPLLLWAVMVMAEPKPSDVPAMIVYGTDGSRQVIRLATTEVTDFVVLQNGQSLSVDIPEGKVNNVRSIRFAMVDKEDTALENTDGHLVRGVEKVVLDGQVFIRLQMPDGGVIEYNIQGNQISTK